LKSAWANRLLDAISKKPHHKNSAGGVAQVMQGVGLEFKPQHWKEKCMQNVF
jgi:hypothetical protein